MKNLLLIQRLLKVIKGKRWEVSKPYYSCKFTYAHANKDGSFNSIHK